MGVNDGVWFRRRGLIRQTLAVVALGVRRPPVVRRQAAATDLDDALEHRFAVPRVAAVEQQATEPQERGRLLEIVGRKQAAIQLDALAIGCFAAGRLSAGDGLRQRQVGAQHIGVVFPERAADRLEGLAVELFRGCVVSEPPVELA